MDEYIKRELAIEALSRGEGCGNVCRRAIERVLAADVAPVRHAKWVFGGDGLVECSVCNETYDVNMLPRNYCPNCGAKMDLEG